MDTTVVVIVFIVALILSVGFLLLIITLIPAINQLKSMLTDLEKTSREVRDLTGNLKTISEKVDRDVDKFDDILEASRETVTTASSTLKFINKNLLGKAAGFLAFLPAIKFGWSLVKKSREVSHER